MVPRFDLLHEGRVVAAGTREAMLAAARLLGIEPVLRGIDP